MSTLNYDFLAEVITLCGLTLRVQANLAVRQSTRVVNKDTIDPFPALQIMMQFGSKAGINWNKIYLPGSKKVPHLNFLSHISLDEPSILTNLPYFIVINAYF